MITEYPSICLCVLQFLLTMSYSFQCTGIISLNIWYNSQVKISGPGLLFGGLGFLVFGVFFLLCFLGLPLQHMEIPRLRVESELQLLATATATRDSSHIYDLYWSSWQCWILDPLSKARDWTCILMDTNHICFCCSTMRNFQKKYQKGLEEVFAHPYS